MLIIVPTQSSNNHQDMEVLARQVESKLVANISKSSKCHHLRQYFVNPLFPNKLRHKLRQLKNQPRMLTRWQEWRIEYSQTLPNL